MTSQQFVKVHRHDNVAVIVMDNPPVNALSIRLLQPLYSAVDEILKDPSLEAMVITGTGQWFISGADIKEFSKLGSSKLKPLNEWCNDLEQSKKPVVIALNGIALGGGLEFAMSGHYRVSIPNVRLGLVELRLGLIPGAGGTQRLPRLVGVKKATEMMLYAQEIKSQEAVKIGLVDELAESIDDLIPKSIEAAKRLIGKPLHRSCDSTDKFQRPYQDEQAVTNILEGMRKAGKIRNQIHFDACADAIYTGVAQGFKRGLRQEMKGFAKCLTSPQAFGLMNVFFSQRECSKVPGITDDRSLEAKNIKKVAVLGGGTMGSGIAVWLLSFGKKVILKEINEKAGENARKLITNIFIDTVKRGFMNREKAESLIKNLSIVTDYSRFKEPDLVIEAIFEDMNLKRNTFMELEKVTRNDCILASNTSTISLDIINEKVKSKDRVIGLHFFSPAHVMKLVEIVRGRHTSKEVILSVVNLVKDLKKLPLVVGNCPGFLVNRIFSPMFQVAGFLINHGIDPYRIDDLMVNFGMAMGPFRTADLSGLDVLVHVGKIMHDSYPDRFIDSNTIMGLLVHEKRLGEKNGRGFYKYEGKKPVKDPELNRFLEEARSMQKDNIGSLQLSDEDVVQMLIFSVANEACRTLEEGIAIRPSDVDLCCVFGYGFPPYRGGVLKYASTVDYEDVYEKLGEWYKKFNLELFKPTPYMLKLAKQRSKL